MRASRLVGVLLLLQGTVQAQGPSPGTTFPPEALLADIDHLQRVIQRKHPAPFLYTSTERLRQGFDSLRSTVHGPMTALRFLSHIAALYPLLADGHTMFLPGAASPVPGQPARYLPLYPVWADGRLVVLRNGSDDPQACPGAEILAINGVPSAAIMDTLMRRQVRDGANSTYPAWILGRYFREYYRFSFDGPDTFDVVLRGRHAPMHLRIAALPADRIRANEALRDPEPRPSILEDDFRRSELLLEPARPIALLTLPSFDDLGARRPGRSANKRHLRGIFDRIHHHRVQSLILALRGNMGGDPALAKALLAHLLDEPFHLVLRGPAQGRCRPVKRPFTGKLVVLMDGGSFSATGMVLSCLERHARATFIGEEAGGNRTVLCGSPARIVLPNTRLDCMISTRLWRLADRMNDGHGVMPTDLVIPTIEDRLQGRDPALLRAFDVVD